ncbi:MAG: NPCBM/NEW2 domain-containing protein [Propionibacteriaceae bacterium]|nr:NPCBM/NEW2 domain-containing protein [Propionibacteriaceae bacterium]
MNIRRLFAVLLSLGLVLPLMGLFQSEPASAEPPVAAQSGDGIDPDITLHDIANRGEAGWLRYRIPSLTQLTNGDILAIYDGRPTMADLPSNITLLMRRSTDGGTSWGPQTIIRQEAAPNGFGDPSVIVDRNTGKVFVFYAASINAGFASSTTGQNHDDKNVLHADYSVSDDDGATWTHHRITSDIKQGRAWGGMFAASGEGIQLRNNTHAGRLIQQYTVRISGANYAVSVYSDDGGATWQTSEPIGPGADENKTVELSNGDVLLNSRAAPYRRVATSTDGGATYTAFSQDTELPDPANNGSIIRAFPDASASDPKSKILLFSNTANQHVRRNLTVRMSCDDGKTWPVSKVVQSGATGYSTLTALADGAGERGGRYGLFYERDGYRHLSFTSFDLDWLDGMCGSISVTPADTYLGGVPTATTISITNQSGGDFAAGTIMVAADQRFSSASVAVPAIAAGSSVTVTVPVTADTTADTRTHDVTFTYSNPSGESATTAPLPVLGGENVLTWDEGAVFSPAGMYTDVSAELSSIATLDAGTIAVDFTAGPNQTVATLLSASVSTSADKDVILSINSGKPYFEVRTGGPGQAVQIASTTNVTIGTRHRLAVSATASGVTMYLDGVAIGSSTSTGFFNSVAGLNSLTIGGNNQNRPERWMFDGTIHAVRVSGPVAADPALTIRPVLDAIYPGGEQGLLGDRIQPWVEVINTGNVPLSTIAFTAPTGANACNQSALAPGASYACKNNGPSHTVTPADMIAGEWATTYTATATGAGRSITATAGLHPVPLDEATVDPGEVRTWIPSDVFASSSFVRVPIAGATGADLAEDASLALRIPVNGRASAQLAVTTADALTGLQAEVTPLTNDASVTLPSDAVQVRYPSFIPDKDNGGLVADPLVDVASIDVEAGQNQPVWFTVRIPDGTAPGTYTAAITISHADGTVGTWPLTVDVPDVAYRDMADRPFVLDLWSQPDTVADYLDLPVWSEAHFTALEPYWADLASAGQRVINVAVTEDPWLVNANGTIRPQTASHYKSTIEWKWDGAEFAFDFTAFDRIVTDSRAAGIGPDIHAFTMLQFQNHDRINYTDTRTGDPAVEIVTVGSARYKEAWTAFLTAFQAHLLDKGWFDDTRLAFDEQPLARMNAAFDVIRAVSPAWAEKIALAANSLAEADIAEYISFNYSFLGSVPQSLIDQRRADDKPTLFYTWNEPTKPNTVTKTPPFNARTLGWVVAQRDLDGFLRWTYNSWPLDIYNDPSFRYDQGDEYIVYPGADGPVSSIRWELFRDGQDDAELLNLAQSELGANDAALRAALDGVNAAGDPTAVNFANLLDHRSAVINALVEGPPPVIATGDVTISKTSVIDSNTGSTTLRVPVRNTTDEAHTVTLAAEGNTVFRGGPTTVTVAAGASAVLTLELTPGGRVGKDSFNAVLSIGDREITSRHFDVVSGGYYLSDADWVSATNGWGPVERDTANGEEEAGDGPVMSLGGVTYTKGLGVHARSVIEYDLGGTCSTLRFDYGIDDYMKAQPGSLKMYVRGDGDELWASGVIATTGRNTAEVDVTDVETLVLDVDPNGANGQDHADWAGIWVQCSEPGSGTPTPSSTATVTSSATVTATATPAVTETASTTATATSSTTATATVTSTTTTTATATATSSTTATATVSSTATVTPSPSPSTGGPVNVYTTPGFHFVNGRHWWTTCEPYSQTTRCRTQIWSTQVEAKGGTFVSTTGWHFNNLTYLPSARSLWKNNPLGNTGSWTDNAGRDWMTECDTDRTGGNGCRTWIYTHVVEATAKPGGGYSYRTAQKWVFNNLVLFS